MSTRVHLLLGSKKGVFFLDGDEGRRTWKVRGPYQGGGVYHVNYDPRSGMCFASLNDYWFGSAIGRSPDFGETWLEEKVAGLRYPEGSGLTLERVWQISPGPESRPGLVYAGVEPAGLFASEDWGATWHEVTGLTQHPTRARWEPGNGGLCLHSILVDPEHSQQIWVGISAAGVFRSEDAGQTWHHANRGLRVELPESSTPEWGQCIHKLAMHPSRPQVIFGQNHWGTYRSDDGGGSWTEVTEGLPSDFGFPIAVHPREPDTIWVVPEVSGFKHFVPDGAMAAWRSRDGGAHWQRLDDGLPREHAYLGILRDALAVDTLDPCGVYVATNTGQVFASSDEGDHWQLIADYLPPLYAIEVAVVA